MVLIGEKFITSTDSDFLSDLGRVECEIDEYSKAFARYRVKWSVDTSVTNILYHGGFGNKKSASNNVVFLASGDMLAISLSAKQRGVIGATIFFT